MASVQRDPGGNFHVTFRFGGQRFKRSLKTKHQRKAIAAASHVEENIRLVEAGRLKLPDDVDIAIFLLSDGNLQQKPKASKTIRLKDLLTRFEQETPVDSLEPTTLKLMGVHMRHVTRILGGGTHLRSIKTATLQQYVTRRSHEPGQRGRKVSGTTIRKEVATFGALWSWAEAHEYVTGAFPRKGLVFPKHEEKPPFQTFTQINRHVKVNHLTTEQAAPLWDCVFLDTKELCELLLHVQETSYYDFLHPMCALAAYTGARRSELCRSLVADFDFEDATFTIRERKRARSQRTTRKVPMAEPVRSVLLDWLNIKPPSPFMFPEDHRFLRQRKVQPMEGAVTPDEASHHLQQTLSNSKWSVICGWHVFRHSFISNCASRGVDQRFIDQWVGHQTDEQRRRYRHLFPESQQAAIDSVFS